MTTPATPKFIFACSGGADVGCMTDQAARQLTARGCGKMFCLAGIGGRVQDIMDRTAQSELLLAIDGCEKDCARNCLAQAGFTNVRHVRLTDLGFEKGKTPVTAENVNRVVDFAQPLMA